MKLVAKTAMAALLALLLCGCGREALPIAETTTEPKVERIAMVVTEQSLLELEQNYPDLVEADLTGSECYGAIQAYAARNPQVQVHYLVRLGSTAAAPDAAALELNPEDFDYSVLRQNLQYLPNLQSLYFRQTTLTPEDIRTLQEEYPGIQIDCSVNFCGILCDGDTVELDVSALDPETVLASAEMLRFLPKLEHIYLMTGEDTTAFTLDQAAQLQLLVPQALLHFSFDLFGQRVSTTDEEVSYANKYIGNQEGALETLRTALTVMRGCERLVLDNCHFTNEELAAVRDEFRGATKVVWRIWFGEGGCLTDRKVIRHVYGLYDYNSTNLIYCEDAEFLDFGHNEVLKQCDFVAGMPNLRAVILSGSMVSDLSPFAACPNLEFLELAYCGYVTDLTPLAGCENLQRLNIAYTKVSDLSPLDNLNLQVLVDARSQTSEEERTRFDQLHPDCLVQHTGDAKDDNPYNYPWRYEQNGDPNEYYALLKEKFGYPNPSNTLW
ncbi:MAG: hypothetical protein ACI3XG_09380 [Faecousia sp.]